MKLSLPAVLTDFENALDTSTGHLSCCTLLECVQACLVLSESDSNKPHLRSSNVMCLTIKALRTYTSNAPRLEATHANGVLVDHGGGGSDPKCARSCMELLLQLFFCFSDEVEWRNMVEQQCPDLNEVLLAVKNLPPDRMLGTHTEVALKHLLCSLGQGHQSQLTSASSAPAAERKHVMLSYCHMAKKQLVVELGASLRAKGVDVWRDEEGSQCVPAMSGSTDDCMAAAIEHSHTIVICVSPAYKASPNCRMEAKYANDMHKRGKVNLVFVMMEQGYTTRSSPEHVDGWLGLMIGDQLWHAMWAGDQVAAAAAAIHGSIGIIASAMPPASPTTTLPAQPVQQIAVLSPCTPSLKRPANAQLPSDTPLAKCLRMLSPVDVHMAPPAAAAAGAPCHQSPSQTPSLLSHPVSGDNAAAVLSSAFETLQDASKALDSASLATLLQNVGVTSSGDLAYLDAASLASIMALLKPVASSFFARVAACIRHLQMTWSVQADELCAEDASRIRDACFAYLLDTTAHIDNSSMASLLHQIGLSQSHEIQFLDDSQLSSIVSLLKPVAARAFVHMMALVRRRP